MRAYPPNKQDLSPEIQIEFWKPYFFLERQFMSWLEATSSFSKNSLVRFSCTKKGPKINSVPSLFCAEFHNKSTPPRLCPSWNLDLSIHLENYYSE